LFTRESPCLLFFRPLTPTKQQLPPAATAAGGRNKKENPGLSGVFFFFRTMVSEANRGNCCL